MLEKLQDVQKRYLKLERALSDPEVIADNSRFHKYVKEHSELTPLVTKLNKYDQVVREIGETEELMRIENDEEFLQLAREELADLKKKRDLLEHDVKLMLVPKDPNEGKNVIVEIRAGTGGDEAGLFASEIIGHRHAIRPAVHQPAYHVQSCRPDLPQAVTGTHQ